MNHLVQQCPRAERARLCPERTLSACPLKDACGSGSLWSTLPGLSREQSSLTYRPSELQLRKELIPGLIL